MGHATPCFYLTADPCPVLGTAPILIASIIAEYMLCVKLYESWALYFLADIASIILFASIGAPITAAHVYVVFALPLSRRNLCMASCSLKPSTPALSLRKFNPLTKGHQHLHSKIRRARVQRHAVYFDQRKAGRGNSAVGTGVLASPAVSPGDRRGESADSFPIIRANVKTKRRFTRLWTEELKRVCGGKSPDALFTSEDYGDVTASHLGFVHVAVDPERKQFPISRSLAGARENPYALGISRPDCPSAWYVKTICVLGPESTGKTTLCKNLAAHFQTVWQPEWARDYLGHRHCTYEDMEPIAKGHAKQHHNHCLRAKKILFQDNKAITT